MKFTPNLIEATENMAAVISCVRPYSSRPIIIDIPFNRLPHSLPGEPGQFHLWPGRGQGS